MSKFTVGGYINAVDRPSQLLKHKDGRKFVEYIKPGTFADALTRNKEIYLLHEHRANDILAKTSDKTLNVYENQIGLKFTAQIEYDDTLYRSIKNNEYGNSFGMKVLKDDWIENRDGTYTRSISKIELFEVTLTKNPAYKGSETELRNMDGIEYRNFGIVFDEISSEINMEVEMLKLRKRKML